MAAPRRMQWVALRNLAKAGSQQQVRHLHMTGPATYSSPVLSQERPATNLPRDMAGLRAECKRRKLDVRGNKQELVNRLNAEELTQSRAFSTTAAQTKRPVAEDNSDAAAAPARHFNTSRTLKAVNDSSPLDFAYMPSQEAFQDADLSLRVPILPDNYSPPRTGAHAPLNDASVVLKPQVNAMSADSVYLPLQELHDGHAMNIDFHALAESVASQVQKMGVPMQERAGLMKQIWGDMMDDILGSKRKAVA
ncbi:hypothetical protein MBLNU230_g1595t1 [Neophaeotheca triangularis]